MNLLKVLSNIEEYSDEETIYAVKPWTVTSDAIVMVEPNDGALEFTVDRRVYSYFLETFLIKEFLSDLSEKNGLPLEGRTLRIIQYASNDA
ncbi:hypothetical protein [Acinetobacter sp. ANC 4973]|uniref:hypothetical protein n=1 Tax=Acinetobacter sp. ANC 4973 TaxID=1977871 RepID=UPI000A33B788|nr:hypothetical protein [Acinetobacter sp. ANC 4973]OTG97660.1 hypothetical protein B9T30_14125 [Acinetobacter sp. ANC 4973]